METHGIKEQVEYLKIDGKKGELKNKIEHSIIKTLQGLTLKRSLSIAVGKSDWNLVAGN